MIMVLGALLTAPTLILAEEGQEYANHGHAMEATAGNVAAPAADTKATAEAVEVGNKICPVSGEKVPEPGAKGDMGEAVKYEYNGKIYNLCCKMCIKDFKKDPEKYIKKVDAELKASGEQK